MDGIEGILLVNKPPGCTSHDVVDIARRKLGIRRVGHAGTLDPSASGLLIILVGRYTKFFNKFSDFDKEYIGTMKLGEVTTTADAEGEVIRVGCYDDITEEKIKETFASFQGEILQTPPMVSAKRVGGKRLYELARKGIVIDRPPQKVKIYEFKVLEIKKPLIKFYVKCSKGTYIRKLAEDVGEKLGCGAYVLEIVRISIGPFKLEEAISLEEISVDKLRTYSFDENNKR